MSNAIRILLVASLALNVFIAGAFASHAFRRGDFGHEHHWRSRGMDLRMLRGELPPEDQPIADAALTANRDRIRQRVAALHEARVAAAEALRAEPFDAKRLDTALATVRQREAELTEAAQATMAGLAGRVSADGRKKMAEQMLARKAHGGPGGACRDEKPDTPPS